MDKLVDVLIQVFLFSGCTEIYVFKYAGSESTLPEALVISTVYSPASDDVMFVIV